MRAVGETSFMLRVDGGVQGELTPGEERTLALDPGEHHLLAIAEGLTREHDARLPPGGAITIELSAPHPESIEVGLVVGISVGSAAAVVLAVVIGVVAASSSRGPVYDYPVTMTRF